MVYTLSTQLSPVFVVGGLNIAAKPRRIHGSVETAPLLSHATIDGGFIVGVDRDRYVLPR